MPMRLTTYGLTRTALPGVPWRDLSDEEWTAACARYPGIEERGYFEPFTEEQPAPKKSNRGGAGGSAGGALVPGRVEIISIEHTDNSKPVAAEEAP